jgi:hypothetical protein
VVSSQEPSSSPEQRIFFFKCHVGEKLDISWFFVVSVSNLFLQSNYYICKLIWIPHESMVDPTNLMVDLFNL